MAASVDQYPGDKWEYIIVSARTTAQWTLQRTLNEYGRHGWEAVGFTSADKTIGLNSLEVIMKRRILPGFHS